MFNTTAPRADEKIHRDRMSEQDMTDTLTDSTTLKPFNAGARDMKLEVLVLPVSDVDRAMQFYGNLGWRLDMDFARDKIFRVVQFTPPGSQCSIIFGSGITSAKPGSAQGLCLVVSDIFATRSALAERGVEISEVFHDAGGIFFHDKGKDRVAGPAPERRSYGSYASFNDPDGNGWVFQEVTTRLPGHVDTNDAIFTSPIELAGALRRAASAYEKRKSGEGADWALWHADYIVQEQSGKQPSA
jgi:catechol 2,3-dioxygenase-like lactoylglutathione lyase family enzyme